MSWSHGIKDGPPLDGTRISHEEIESEYPADLGLGVLSKLMGHQVSLKSANGLRSKKSAFFIRERVGKARLLEHYRHLAVVKD